MPIFHISELMKRIRK